MKKTLILLLCSALIISVVGCIDGDSDTGSAIKTAANIALNTQNEIPLVENRNETGAFIINIFEDNHIEYSITINDLSSSDALTVAHIHAGDPVSTGVPIITLVDGTNIAFQGNKAIGTLQLTEAEITTLLGNDLYVNVHSTEQPTGLVRGQLDQIITNAFNVMLSPSNEVPAIDDRNDSGMAILRIVKDKDGNDKLFYNVSVMDIEMDDAITAGNIHSGAATENGDVVINLELTDDTQLGITKSLILEGDVLTQLKNDALYINLHSTDKPDGLIRGQIR